MPLPTPRDVHVDAALSAFSVAFLQGADGFVADKVFPIVPVQKQSDLYFVYDRADWQRIEAALRAPATEAAGGGFRYATQRYDAAVRAIAKDVDEQTRANADAAINVDRDASEWVTQQLLLRRERDWLDRFFLAGLWAGNPQQDGVAAGPAANQFLQFNNPASDPIEVVGRQSDVILGVTGKKPNVLVMGARVYRELRNHVDILDRIRFTQRGVLSEELLGTILDVDRVVVARAVSNPAAEGAAATTAFMAGNHMLLAYAEPNPGLMKPTAGYTFAWTGYAGASAYGTRVSRIPIPLKRAERVEGEMAYDHQRVAAELAVFFNGAVA